MNKPPASKKPLKMSTSPVFIKILQFRELHGKLPDVFFFNPDDKDLVTPIEGVEFRYSGYIERHTFLIGLKDNIDSFFNDSLKSINH